MRANTLDMSVLLLGIAGLERPSCADVVVRAFHGRGIREQERQSAEAERSAANDADRKERAWAAYYRKPPGCADAATMECTNHYIRARRAFETSYAKEQH
jgi:hypothetical protein